MIVKVVKRVGCELWRVVIRQGHQQFHIGYDGTKEEAQWMAKMFRKALKNHNNEINRSQ